jgi:hypothetical protein
MTNLYNESAPAFSGGPAKSALTAFFDSRSDAEQAVDRLKEAGVTDVRLMPGYEADDEKAEVGSDDRAGFWARLEDWLFPDEDRAVYAEGLRRGGFLVSAAVDEATYETAHDILNEHGAIDMDERADEWRGEGWAGRLPTEALSTRAFGPAVQKREYDNKDGSAQAASLQEDAFAADAANRAVTGTGRYMRSDDPASSRVRASDLEQAFPIDDELRDDVLPTGHQRTVEDEADPAAKDARQSQDLPGMHQGQIFPRGR